MAASHRCTRFPTGCAHYALILGISCSALQAQPDYQLSKILFEPHPVPAADLAAYEAAENVTAAAPTPVPAQRYAASAPYSRFSFIGSAGLSRRELVTKISDADRDNAEAAIAAYRDTVTDTESETGPFASELIEQLLSLGQAYQQLEQHEEAMATLEKAEYIGRINNGLFAPSQFAVVEQMVDNLIASGDMREAMRKQQYLLYLNTQVYGSNSTQVVPALERLGDWSMEAFESGVQDSTFEGFIVTRGNPGLIPNAPPRPNMSPRGQAILNLDTAQNRYYQAISNLLDANDFRNPQLLELEEKLQRSIYFGAHRIGLMKDPNFYLGGQIDTLGTRISYPEFTSSTTTFSNGRNSLQRTLIYLQTTPGSDPMARVVTLLNLGDWHTLFNRMFESDDFYREAAELAATMPERRAEWEPLLAPDVPRQLPDFITLPHSRATFGITDDASVEFDGYIDVWLSLTRSGDVRRMKVLKMTDNATPKLTSRLRRLIRGAPYRPALEDGDPVASEKAVRYYFADMREETRI